MTPRWGWVAVVVTLACLVGLDLDLSALSEATRSARALESVGAMLDGVTSPDLSAPMLERVASLAAETVAIAALGTGLGAAVGLGIAVAAVSSAATRAPSRARQRHGKVSETTPLR